MLLAVRNYVRVASTLSSGLIEKVLLQVSISLTIRTYLLEAHER